MNKVSIIHKQAIKLGLQSIALPVGSILLSVQPQNDQIVLWYEFSPEVTGEEKRMILGIGTGHRFEFPAGRIFQFLGTVQENSFVWHFYGEDSFLN